MVIGTVSLSYVWISRLCLPSKNASMRLTPSPSLALEPCYLCFRYVVVFSLWPDVWRGNHIIYIGAIILPRRPAGSRLASLYPHWMLHFVFLSLIFIFSLRFVKGRGMKLLRCFEMFMFLTALCSLFFVSLIKTTLPAACSS